MKVERQNMQLAPKYAIWLNVLYAILTGLSAPMLQAAGIANSEQVIAWAALIAMPLNVVLHAFSSTVPGPLAPPDSVAASSSRQGGLTPKN